MFSQYSWGDFIKFVLVLAVPYYAYILWKYYREDIREWISNRGQLQPAPITPEIDDEDGNSSIFTSTDYSQPDVPRSVATVATRQTQPAEWLPVPFPAPTPTTQLSSTRQVTVPGEQEIEELELQGPALNSEPEVVFGFPVLQMSDNSGEKSVDQFIHAATRLTTDEEGQLTPKDAQDESAARLAHIINHQANPLDNFPFNR